MTSPAPNRFFFQHALPTEGASVDNSALLDRFLEALQTRNLRLYDAQETAILELFDEKNVILNTPTGSGKSLVATALHFQSLAHGRRSIYTCPIKALVNEKWLALCRDFGAENVGLSTGDATVNRHAPILCCTAEILSNIALREGANAPVQDVVMDEFHYYADPSRGVAWQVPLLTLPNTRFLLMSATLGDTSFFESTLTNLNGRPTSTIRSITRPVPLAFEYSETPVPVTLERLLSSEKTPVYVVHFTQLEAAQSAQDFTSINLCSREEKALIAQTISGFSFSSPYGPEIRKWLKHGIGLHHAGLLPKYRILVEQLAQKGLLKVICGTDTLGVGINVPIRSVLFTQLCKFGGDKTAILSARDFHQISGRAGRKGYDENGWVLAQAPAHVIENLQLEQKQAATGKTFVKRKAPERNYIAWDKQTFARLIDAPPERLKSHFEVTHGMLLNVLSRPENGPQAMRKLIQDSHESAASKKKHTKRAWQLLRSLLERGIIEVIRNEQGRTRLSVNADLQDDFSLNHTLSLFIHETVPQLDPNAPDYALVVLTLVESILENPEPILRKQLDKVKSQALAEMKSQGMDFQQRMDELEKLEHPKPNRDFIYATFNAFAEKHPWVGSENIRPKSIVREMFEEYRTFSDYIKVYELHRCEGLLLRHIASVYKVLTQSVPDTAKNQPLREMETYLGEMLRQIDSSLLEQWELLQNPTYSKREISPEIRPPGAESAEADITRDHRAFTLAIRNQIFGFLRGLLNEDYETALQAIASASQPQAPPPIKEIADTISQALAEYHTEHTRIRLDPAARNIQNTFLSKSDDGKTLRVEQTLVDPDEFNDWVAEFSVNLEHSRTLKQPVLTFLAIRPVNHPFRSE